MALCEVFVTQIAHFYTDGPQKSEEFKHNYDSNYCRIVLADGREWLGTLSFQDFATLIEALPDNKSVASLGNVDPSVSGSFQAFRNKILEIYRSNRKEPLILGSEVLTRLFAPPDN